MKPKGSGTFLNDDDKMLWLALLTRDTGRPASERLQIRDEVTALSFDLAVSLRLYRFDNEKDAENKRFWKKMIAGETSDDDGDGDSYRDENTETW